MDLGADAYLPGVVRVDGEDRWLEREGGPIPLTGGEGVDLRDGQRRTLGVDFVGIGDVGSGSWDDPFGIFPTDEGIRCRGKRQPYREYVVYSDRKTAPFHRSDLTFDQGRTFGLPDDRIGSVSDRSIEFTADELRVVEVLDRDRDPYREEPFSDVAVETLVTERNRRRVANGDQVAIPIRLTVGDVPAWVDHGWTPGGRYKVFRRIVEALAEEKSRSSGGNRAIRLRIDDEGDVLRVSVQTSRPEATPYLLDGIRLERAAFVEAVCRAAQRWIAVVNRHHPEPAVVAEERSETLDRLVALGEEVGHEFDPEAGLAARRDHGEDRWTATADATDLARLNPDDERYVGHPTPEVAALRDRARRGDAGAIDSLLAIARSDPARKWDALGALTAYRTDGGPGSDSGVTGARDPTPVTDPVESWLLEADATATERWALLEVLSEFLDDVSATGGREATAHALLEVVDLASDGSVRERATEMAIDVLGGSDAEDGGKRRAVDALLERIPGESDGAVRSTFAERARDLDPAATHEWARDQFGSTADGSLRRLALETIVETNDQFEEREPGAATTGNDESNADGNEGDAGGDEADADGNDARRILTAALSDPAVSVRRVAAGSVGKFPCETPVEALERRVRTDDDPEVRRKSLRALGRLLAGHTDRGVSRDLVVSAFADPDASVAIAAMTVARSLDPPPVRAYLDHLGPGERGAAAATSLRTLSEDPTDTAASNPLSVTGNTASKRPRIPRNGMAGDVPAEGDRIRFRYRHRGNVTDRFVPSFDASPNDTIVRWCSFYNNWAC